MTTRQEIMLNRVKALISDTRSVLDDIMYRSDPLSDDEYNKIRDSYDFICNANDKLP